jgi:hypothetical protein
MDLPTNPDELADSIGFQVSHDALRVVFRSSIPSRRCVTRLCISSNLLSSPLLSVFKSQPPRAE